MASPFRLFRKHVKPLLAAFVVLLMLSWVVGDSLRGLLGPSLGGKGREGALAPSAVAVHWDGGSLTNQEVANLVMRRRLVNAFVRTVEAGGEQAAIDAGVEPRPLRVARVAGVESHEQGVEQDVVLTRIFADLARKAGMRISDEAIVSYLDELGRQHVSRDDMRTIIQRMQGGGMRASIDYILDALREELLARNYLASYHFSFFTVTPEERWIDWLQVNDRVALEAVAYPAEKFLVDVAEPTEAELAAFFERKDESGTSYKDRVPQPDFQENTELPSPHPGFAVPRKIDVQYIMADYDKFLTKVESEITDEEIEKYYEENKDPLFIKAASLLMDEQSKSESSDDNDDAATDGGATGAEKTSATESPAEDKPPAVIPAEPDGNTPAESSTQPSESGAETEDKAEAEPSQSDQSSDRATSRPSPFHLTALLQEPGGTPPSETADTVASPTADRSKDTVSTPDAASPPASTAPTGDTPAPADDAAPSTNPPSEKPKEFQPLDEVRDEIRRELASQRVTQQLIDLMTKLYGEIDAEFTKYFASTLDAQAGDDEDQEGSPPPLPPPTGVLADLKSLADKNGLEYGTTGPLSLLEMRDSPVGKSIDPELRVQMWQILFGSTDLEMYQPVSTFDIEGNRFLAMKTSDTRQSVPTLAEVRDDVVKAWKLQEAAKLAEKHAADVAKKAQESGSTLSDYFAGDPSVTVIRTDPFSWLTGGEVSRITGQPQPFRLSEPDGVVAAGPDFMEEVFELDGDQVGAVLNNDHSIAYVVRVANHELTPDELRTAYLAEANTWPGLLATTSARSRQAIRALLDDVREGAHLRWERPADQVEQEE